MSEDSKKMLRFTGLCAISALAFYVLAWSFLQWSRTHRGAWEYAFTPTGPTEMVVEIHQKSLGIEGVKLTFTGLSAEDQLSEPVTVAFNDVTVEPPVGTLFYHDLMSLPGVVNLSLFGHQIETLPRGLFIDGEEIAWEDAVTNAIPFLEKREAEFEPLVGP